jgi:hypothetical protein
MDANHRQDSGGSRPGNKGKDFRWSRQGTRTRQNDQIAVRRYRHIPVSYGNGIVEETATKRNIVNKI